MVNEWCTKFYQKKNPLVFRGDSSTLQALKGYYTVQMLGTALHSIFFHYLDLIRRKEQCLSQGSPSALKLLRSPQNLSFKFYYHHSHCRWFMHASQWSIPDWIAIGQLQAGQWAVASNRSMAEPTTGKHAVGTRRGNSKWNICIERILIPIQSRQAANRTSFKTLHGLVKLQKVHFSVLFIWFAVYFTK